MAGTGDTSIRSYNFFLDTTIGGTGLYTDPLNEHDFIDQIDGTNFLSNSIQVILDGAADIWWSFDGVTDFGRVIAGQPITQDFRRFKKIWFRGTAGTAFRFWAW